MPSTLLALNKLLNDWIQFFKFIFNWRIFALKCIGSYHTATSIRHKPTYIPSFLNVAPTPPPSDPRGCHYAPGWAPCVAPQIPTSSLFHTWSCMYFNAYSLNSSHPRLCLLCPQVRSLCLCLYSCPANRFINPIFLEFNIQYLFYSFSCTSLYITGSRFIHLSSTDSNLFLLWLSNVHLSICTTSSLFISVNGHLGCSHVLVIVNSAAMNIRVYVTFWIMIFSGYMSSSRIAGSYGSFIPSF